jgi:mannose-6-phosphate isomerase-like protein (cupin superfamily)
MCSVRSLNELSVETQESVMAGDYFISDLRTRAVFTAGKPAKQDCFRSGRLFTGLTCLAAGQSQRIHVHEAVDKFYLVISGKASIVVGGEARELGPGGMAWAPAGIPHGVEPAREDVVLLVGMAPGPDKPQA